MNRANEWIDQANMDSAVLLNIERNQELGKVRGQDMSSINNMAYVNKLKGGINANYLRAGREGLKLPESIQDLIKSGKKQLPKVKDIVKIKTIVKEITILPTDEDVKFFK